MILGDKVRRPVKTVETAFEIFEYLKENDGATMSEIAGHIQKAKSTVHRHLTTLEQLEYVVKINGQYFPSLRFLDYGQYTQNRHPAYSMVKSKLNELAEETDERAQFIVEEYGKGVYVHRSVGSHAVMTDPGIGKSRYLHAAAAGKVILAHLSTHRVEQIIDFHGLPATTEQTITDRNELFEELEQIRERGYSTNLQENTKGLRAVGVVILGPDESVIGALSVSGPTRRMDGAWFKRELPNLLLGTANELELNIAHM